MLSIIILTLPPRILTPVDTQTFPFAEIDSTADKYIFCLYMYSPLMVYGSSEYA